MKKIEAIIKPFKLDEVKRKSTYFTSLSLISLRTSFAVVMENLPPSLFHPSGPEVSLQ